MLKLTTSRLKEIAQAVKKVKVAVYGDFCLDVYWFLSEKGGEISVETSLQAEAVERTRYSPGGAANIIANLAALEPAAIHCIGATGDDLFGHELRRQLDARSAHTDGLIVQAENFDTYTYIKRYLYGIESPRIDLGMNNQLSPESITAILDHIQWALDHCDVLLLNQQVPGSLYHPALLNGLNQLIESHSSATVLLDTRHYGNAFTHIHRKINEAELAALMGAGDGEFTTDQLINWGKKLFDLSSRPVFITCGEAGLWVVSGEDFFECKPPAYEGATDPVGAGDTLLSALSLALAAGISLEESAEFAVLAASVSVRKLFQTGTASLEEMMELFKD